METSNYIADVDVVSTHSHQPDDKVHNSLNYEPQQAKVSSIKHPYL